MYFTIVHHNEKRRKKKRRSDGSLRYLCIRYPKSVFFSPQRNSKNYDANTQLVNLLCYSAWNSCFTKGHFPINVSNTDELGHIVKFFTANVDRYLFDFYKNYRFSEKGREKKKEILSLVETQISLWFRFPLLRVNFSSLLTVSVARLFYEYYRSIDDRDFSL